ncbi:MAG: DUF427 domain-containing protein [Gammaproteobacteria bacterium]
MTDTKLPEESVWDYPRPAVCEIFNGHCQVMHQGRVIAATRQAYRALETSHPPTYYFPPADVDQSLLSRGSQQSYCEWKGPAIYWNIRINNEVLPNAAWSYPAPTPGFALIKDYLAFYPSRFDQCLVNGIAVIAQAGDFYGGWITPNLKGPFKGKPGSGGW